MEESSTYSHETEGEMEKSLRDPVEAERELRLVLLGWAGSGKSSVGNAVLGFRAFKTWAGTDSQKPVTVKCDKKCASVDGRLVSVIDTPDWFYSERPPEDMQQQLFLCESMSTPGPQGFLLCISLHRPNNKHLQALAAVEKVFGSEAVSKHTIVLFTHTGRLSKDLALKEHLSSEHQDLLELLEKCGDRHHILTVQEEGEEEGEKERESVEGLLEKVEEMVKVSGEEFYTFPPLVQTDAEGRGRDEAEENEGKDLSDEIVRRRTRGEEGERGEETAEEGTDGLEPVEDEAGAVSSSPPQSFVRWLWDSVLEWVLWLPSMLRGSTLLGSLVGLFVGGAFGGAMGSTVGSVATEIERRKHKSKSK